MGGFAVVIDWDRPVDPHATVPMMALVPHRATGGIRTNVTAHAVLTEGRTTHQVDGGPWEVATLGPLAIVGDIRLFDTGRLRVAAGGSAATQGLDDRRLLLAAYRRRGIGFLDAVDGDFAFVIWDDSQRSVLAVRDRFAVKPIFYEETPTGIRFTSEVKQLAVTSLRPPEPDLLSLAEYVTYDFREKRRTFLTGIQRIPASEAIVADGHAPRALRYWDPTPPTARHEPSSLPHLFREHLIAAVDRRLKTSRHTVSQLSGGLDSPSIAAAAAILASRGEPVALTTVSAVYDFPSIDESEWIHDIVASQPFPHREFVPEVADIDQFDADMWTVDGPFVDPNRDMDRVTAEIAAEIGASLALTGAGGDHLLYQARYLGDILRSGHLHRFAQDAVAYARWSRMGLLPTVSGPVREATPRRLRSILGRARRGGNRSSRQTFLTEAITGTLVSRLEDNGDLGFRTATQNAIASDLRQARLAWTNETQALVLGEHEISLSHPFLDRDLAQFIVSIDPLDLPFDGRSKTLARQGFEKELPGSVLGRRFPTFADEYMQEALRPQRTAYRSRFGQITALADDLIDAEAYEGTLQRYDRGTLPPRDVHDLWRSWRAMAWLDAFGKYRSAVG